MSLLLTRKARVDVRGEGGATALLHAADRGYPDCVRLLLKARASVDLANVHGHTPLIRTMYWNNNVWRNHDSLQILMEAKADVNAVGEHGNTALHVAAFRGHYEALAMLINAKADVDIQNYEGATPLVRAAAWGNIESMAVLIRLGRVGINQTDKLGRTALVHAASLGRLDAVRMLIDCGADWRKPAYDGKAALDYAQEKNADQVVALLQATAAAAAGNSNAAKRASKDAKKAAAAAQLLQAEADAAAAAAAAANASASGEGSGAGLALSAPASKTSALEDLCLALRAETCLGVFKENGITEPEDLLLLKEADWAELIKPLGTRRRLQAWAANNGGSSFN